MCDMGRAFSHESQIPAVRSRKVKASDISARKCSTRKVLQVFDTYATTVPSSAVEVDCRKSGTEVRQQGNIATLASGLGSLNDRKPSTDAESEPTCALMLRTTSALEGAESALEGAPGTLLALPPGPRSPPAHRERLTRRLRFQS